MTSHSARVVVWVLAIISCLAGIFLTIALTMDHLELKGYTPPVAGGAIDANEGWLDAICSATATASCEEVAKSKYAVWPFDSKDPNAIPVALLGMFYFTAVLVWFGLVGSCSPSRWWAHLLPVIGTAVGVGVSAFFEYVMWTDPDLGHYCPLCVITHVLALLLLVFTLLLWPRAAKPTRGRPVYDETAWPSGNWPTLRILVATPIVALVAIWAEFLWLAPASAQLRSPAPSASATTKPIDEKALMATLSTQPADALAKQIVELQKKVASSDRVQNNYRKELAHYYKWEHAFTAWEIAPQVPIDTEGRPFRGAANAPHTLVVYSDFACPGCKKFEDYVNKRLLPLSERRGGLVRILFKYWPICTDCSPYAHRNLHPAACKAALAAEAALIVGGEEAYWKMYDLLWKTQDRWKGWKHNRDFNALAREIGVDEAAFERAMAGDQAMAQVKADLDEGANLGKNLPDAKPEALDFIKVNGTPVIFADNKRVWRPHLNDALWYKIMTSPVHPSTQPSPMAPGPAPADEAEASSAGQ
jgi:uncharacterized membrane protein/protein-disulfide isomerase